MKKVSSVFLLACACVAASAQSSHHHAMESMPPDALSRLGKVHLPISCAPSVQTPFDQGVALLHSFWYEEARKRFTSVAAADPSCAMAYWGLAMTEWRPFWDGLPDDRRKTGVAEIDKAAKLASATDQEHRYITALSRYLHNSPDQNAAAAERYATDLGALSHTHPDQPEALAFYGLALATAANTEPDPIAGDRKALAVLMPGFRAHPDHPGFAHYLIHTCDSPQLARQALPAAQKYASIAPDSAHALHMPGHIFARLGMWPEDIAANRASVQASEDAAARHLDGAAHEMHAYEFLLYAYLQDGDDAHARQIADGTQPMVARLSSIPGIQNDGMFGFISFPQVEFPAIYHLERHEWQEVLQIAQPPSSIPFTNFYRAWARSIAAGHLRNTAVADQAVAQAQSLYKTVEQQGLPNGGDLHASLLTMQAWQSYAHGNTRDALLKLSSAADLQDRVGQAEVDIPVREMYADLLQSEGQHAEALTQYKRSLELSPNRLNGLSGAAHAATDLKKTDEARSFNRRILDLTSPGGGSQRIQVLDAQASTKSKLS